MSQDFKLRPVFKKDYQQNFQSKKQQNKKDQKLSKFISKPSIVKQIAPAQSRILAQILQAHPAVATQKQTSIIDDEINCFSEHNETQQEQNISCVSGQEQSTTFDVKSGNQDIRHDENCKKEEVEFENEVIAEGEEGKGSKRASTIVIDSQLPAIEEQTNDFSPRYQEFKK